MVSRRVWFDRRFTLGLPIEAFPDVVERVRGTPARIEERIRDLRPEALVHRTEEAWSIQENVGHLLDLEPLWLGRVDDLLDQADGLRPADLQNTKTEQANHNDRECSGLLAEFRTARAVLVARVEATDESELSKTLLHPRLQEPMNMIDHLFFVAEHDDHHLARITETIRG